MSPDRLYNTQYTPISTASNYAFLAFAYLSIMLFSSKLCQVCVNTLTLAFESTGDRKSVQVEHHLTKGSLIDSVLHRNCHLCRFIVYHFRMYWGPMHRQGLEDLKEEPTSLTEDDFALSDFDFATFPGDQMTIRSYFLELPEDLNFQVRINKYGDGNDGVFGIVEFTCNTPNENDVGLSTTRFWIFDKRGTPSLFFTPSVH